MKIFQGRAGPIQMGTGSSSVPRLARPRAVAFADTTNRRDQQSENELWVNCKGKWPSSLGYPRYRPRHGKALASEGAYVFILADALNARDVAAD